MMVMELQGEREEDNPTSTIMLNCESIPYNLESELDKRHLVCGISLSRDQNQYPIDCPGLPHIHFITSNFPVGKFCDVVHVAHSRQSRFQY